MPVSIFLSLHRTIAINLTTLLENVAYVIPTISHDHALIISEFHQISKYVPV
jgi:hypothetical protein